MDSITFLRLHRDFARRIPYNTCRANILLALLLVLAICVSFSLDILLERPDMTNSTVDWLYLNASSHNESASYISVE